MTIPNKKLSLLIFSHSTTSTRQYTFSKVLLLGIAGCLFIGLGAVGYVVYDYAHMKQSVSQKMALEYKLSEQQHEILSQREKIQGFADAINALKSKIVALNGLENKIRVIANVDPKSDDEGPFGIGGPLPYDLDPTMALTQRHNELIDEMHQQVEQLDLASALQRDGLEELLTALEKKRAVLLCTPSIRPAKGWTTSKFGYRKSPFTGRKELHKGYDISAPKGTPIVATADGVINFSAKKGFMGKMVVIDHGHGMKTRYGHCSKLLKKKGAKVRRGETIALIGNTGRSTGPHVHYEVLAGGIPVNPAKYIFN